jgi:hypothetical protein
MKNRLVKNPNMKKSDFIERFMEIPTNKFIFERLKEL